jgi:hypothetical protein
VLLLASMLTIGRISEPAQIALSMSALAVNLAAVPGLFLAMFRSIQARQRQLVPKTIPRWKPPSRDAAAPPSQTTPSR